MTLIVSRFFSSNRSQQFAKCKRLRFTKQKGEDTRYPRTKTVANSPHNSNRYNKLWWAPPWGPPGPVLINVLSMVNGRETPSWVVKPSTVSRHGCWCERHEDRLPRSLLLMLRPGFSQSQGRASPGSPIAVTFNPSLLFPTLSHCHWTGLKSFLYNNKYTLGHVWSPT